MDATSIQERPSGPHGEPAYGQLMRDEGFYMRHQADRTLHRNPDVVHVASQSQANSGDVVQDKAHLMEPAIALTEPHLRAPAWTRVKTAARSSSTVRHIMRRINTLALKWKKKSRKEPAEDVDKCELPPAKHQRTEAFKPCQDAWKTVGCPQSKAEIASMVMAAKVEIANHVQDLSDEALVNEVDYLLNSVDAQNVPAKRVVDRHYRLEQAGIVGGFRLKTYNLIWPILVKGAATAGRKIDLQAAAFAQLFDRLQKMRQDPRIPLARLGHPDLSDVVDQTEPDSFFSLVKAPVATAPASSPMKRAAQPTSPIPAKRSRLSETKIELPPTSSPRTEPSPVKSPPLSASCADTPAPRKIVATSPTLETSGSGSFMRVAADQMSSSPLRANAAAGASQVPPGDVGTESTPTRVFRAPSYIGSTTSSGSDTSDERADAQEGDEVPAPDPKGAQDQNRDNFAQGAEPSDSPQDPKVASASPVLAGKQPSPAQVSPVNHSRLLPSTPARRESSPHASGQTSFSGTPAAPDPSVSLANAISLSTPPLSVSKAVGPDTSKSSQFDFGTTSSCFNSPSPIAPSWADPRRSIKDQKTLRRKSEPLFRTFFRNRAPSRLSASPKKVAFQDGLVDESTPKSLDSPLEHEPFVANAYDAHPQHHLHTPDMTISPAITVSGAATPAISWGYMTGRAVSDAPGQSTPQTTNQVNDRDMHRNPNIFGGEVGTPAKRRVTAVAQLARIAEARCDDQAKVVVTQEHGRLFARFKLPTKYAFMFPRDQGFEESRFSTTPSISSSPRIRFEAPHLSGKDAVASPRPSPLRTPVVVPADDHDGTLVYNDFAPSPVDFYTQLTSGDRDSLAGCADNSRSLSFGATADFHINEHPTTVAYQQNGSLYPYSDENEATTPHTPHHEPMDQSGSPLTDLMSVDVALAPPTDHAEADHAANETKPMQDDVEMSEQPAVYEKDTTTNTTGFIDEGVDKSSSYYREQPTTHTGEDDEVVHMYHRHQCYIQTGDQRISPTYGVNPHHMTQPTSQAGDYGGERDTVIRYGNHPGKSCESGGHGQGYNDVGQGFSSRNCDHDSPGREYMREFISRARPQRLSATETGSPFVLSARRQPLGAKDPNTESPRMAMRRTRVDEQEAHSPFKRGTAPVLHHHSLKAVGQEDQPVGDMEPEKPAGAREKLVSAQASDEEMVDAPAARRSSRLRTLRRPLATPKSSIPTSIRVGSRSGSRRGHPAKPKSKPGQPDVGQQTRINTRKNRGNAEYPAQVLVRPGFDEMQVDAQASHPSEANKASRSTKSVGWQEPLESRQEEASRGGAAPKAKGRATQGRTGVEKLPRPDAAARKKRSAQVVKSLGLATRGTPGKPGPVTRAAARAQKS